MKKYALYNSAACSGKGKSLAAKLEEILVEDEIVFQDIREIDCLDFLSKIEADAPVILCGGDGTISRFVNTTYGQLGDREVYCFACGNGNDFMREVDGGEKVVKINDYIKSLPVATIKGQQYRFLNVIGYGIDGYCCEEGDRIHAKKPEKKVNYTAVAIKGLLFKYKPATATITVDGVTHTFKNVWIAPTAVGKYYGGGMIPCPDQSRHDPEKKVSVMVFHGKCRLKILTIFPSIFKGEHVKATKTVSVFTGHDIHVAYDGPRPLQVDGETILDVTEYSVKADI